MSGDLVRQLKDLAGLHSTGMITAEEFAVAKSRLLGEPKHRPGAAEQPAAPPPVNPLPSPSSPDQARAWPQSSLAGLPRFPTRGPHRARGLAIAVLSGGIITLLAFLAMPMASVPFLGSVTGAGLAGLASQEGALGLLWLVPLAAGTVAAIGGWQQFATAPAPGAHKRASRCVLGLAGATVVAYIIVLAIAQNEIGGSPAAQFGVSATSLTGAGFWFAIIGMLVAGIAAMADLLGLKLRPRNDDGPGRQV